jgi:hypothetical protein
MSALHCTASADIAVKQSTRFDNLNDPDSAETAQILQRRGFWIVPVRPDSKVPIGKDWGKERRSAAELPASFAAEPDAGLAIVRGPNHGPRGEWLLDIEVDDAPGEPQQGEESLRALFDDEPTETMSWVSRRGRHRLYVVRNQVAAIWGDPLKGHRIPEYANVEFLVGGYNAAGAVKQENSTCPPTTTDGFRRYWLNIGDPASLPGHVIAKLDRATAALRLERIRSTTCLDDLQTSDIDDDEDGGDEWCQYRRRAVVAYVEKIDGGVSGCYGSNPTFRAACSIVARGIDQVDEVVRILAEHYNPRCKPLWALAELRHKAEEAVDVVEDRSSERDLRARFLDSQARRGFAPASLGSEYDAPPDPDEDEEIDPEIVAALYRRWRPEPDDAEIDAEAAAERRKRWNQG